MNFGQRYWKEPADQFNNNLILWDKTLSDTKGTLPPKVKVKQIGIQTQPGVTIRFNNNGNIIIGKTGIYEIDLGDTNFEISKIEYIKTSIITPSFIILDAVYEGGNS